MAKVLKVVKADKTVHIVPLTNKAQIMAQNNLLHAHLKWTVEEIDEIEAKKLPWKEQATKLGVDEKVLLAKDEEIKRLKELLLKANETPGAPASTEPETSEKSTAMKAGDAIAKIAELATVEAVNAFVDGETRATVVKAANERIEVLS